MRKLDDPLRAYARGLRRAKRGGIRDKDEAHSMAACECWNAALKEQAARLKQVTDLLVRWNDPKQGGATHSYDSRLKAETARVLDD